MSKISKTAKELADWLVAELGTLHQRSTLEACELVLCASDLALAGPELDAAVARLYREEQAADGQEDLFSRLARQLVLAKSGSGPELRKAFLDTYVVSQRFREVRDVATVAFILTLAIEQPQLLQASCVETALDWFAGRTRFTSDRFEAWACYCLSRSRYRDVAVSRATALLGSRERNGSWANDLARTIGCSHGLALSGCIDRDSLLPTLEWIASRIDAGFARDRTIKAQALKVFGLLGQLPAEEHARLDAKIRSASSVFLSHAHEDKELARRLASELNERGVRVWLDEAELLPGDSLFERIESAIAEMRYLGVILSPFSVASEWVRQELRMGQVLALQSRKVVVLPILAAPCEIPLSLRDKVWCDFTKGYDHGLTALLRRLAPWAVVNVSAT